METESTIRYAAIQNNAGEKICGGFRDNINPILSDEELKMMHIIMQAKDGKLGKILSIN